MRRLSLLGACALLGLVAPALAEPAPNTLDVPAIFKPAQREGYFFVGCRYETVGGKELAAGQMFVQFHVPAEVSQPYPVVMVHGTAQSGINFLDTPDKRTGWVDRFVNCGFAVHVVDQIGRGRWGDNPEVYGPYTRLAPGDLESIFTGQERFDLFPLAKLHTQWPGGPGVRGNAAFDQFYLSQVPYIESALKSEELVDPALIALLEKIGTSVLLTHSQAGVFGWAVSDQRRDLVKAHVAVEPNGPTFFDSSSKGNMIGTSVSEKPAPGPTASPVCRSALSHPWPRQLT